MKAIIKSQADNKRIALHKHIPLASPLVVYIEVSGFCNLKCIFCLHHLVESQLKKQKMSFKLFKKIVDDVSKFPDQIKLLRLCGNGEALLNKDFLRMIKYAKNKNIAKKTELITNGILLNDELCVNLPRFLDRIIISIEGLNSKDYHIYANVNVDMPSLLSHIKSLYAHKGNCTIHIKIHNHAVQSKYKEKQFFRMFGDCCDQIYIENLINLWPHVEGANLGKESGFRFGGEKVTERLVCPQIFKSMQILANGDVTPCSLDWKRINMLGNINHDSLLDIWNGQKTKNLQMKHLSGNKNKLEPCKVCKFNDYSDYDNLDSHSNELLTIYKNRN
jgi:radical SAM protein with 4Fe4S-binding SPASM domain